MHHGSILAGTVVLGLLCSIGLEAQQSDSSASNNTDSPASSLPAAGTVPRLIKFAGAINPQMTQTKESDGAKNPLPAVLGISFSLYELQEGGSPLWSESQKVQLDEQGHYSVLLGATQPEGLPLDLFTNGKALWLGVQAQLPGQTEQPRVLLVAVPYALKAADADTLGGKPASSYLLAQPTQGSAATQSQGASRTTAGAAGAQAQSRAVVGTPTPLAVGGSSSGTLNFLPKWVDTSNDLGNSLLFDNGTNVGIGTTTPGCLNNVKCFPSVLFHAAQSGANTYLTADTGLASGYAGLLLNRSAANANNRLWAIENQPTPDNTSSRFAISTYTDTGKPTGLLTVSRSGNVGVGATTPGNLNGTFFPSVLFHVWQGGANTYLAADTALAGGYAGVLLNRGAAAANNRIWAIENQPTPDNTSSRFAISTYTDAGASQPLLSMLRSGNVGIGTTAPAYRLDVAGNINSSGTVEATGFSGNGSALTGLNPANLTSRTAGISITGSAANLGGVGAGNYARLDIGNSFTGNQTITSGDLSLPQTASASTGVVNLGSSPFIHACCAASTQNTFVGSNAGNFTADATGTTGGPGNNTAVGFRALQALSSGDSNTATGYQALFANNSGRYNTAAGANTLAANTTGGSNTAAGENALFANNTGSHNTAAGVNALPSNTTGSENTAAGENALCFNTSGSFNTAVGYNAGLTSNGSQATGADNTFIGYEAGPGTNTVLTEATAIGALATVNESFALILGGTGGNAVTVGIGTASPFNDYALDADATTLGEINGGVVVNAGGGNIYLGMTKGTHEFRVDSNGGVHASAYNTTGVDFAESVAVRGNKSLYGPGDLLVIERGAHRRLTLSHTPYSTLVAGIYSTKPGVLAAPHPVDANLDGEVPLAIVGIVPCKVTAENGAIHEGDLLVTSSRPGYAMKGRDRRRMLGAVVGKALEPLPKGTGVIEVLVTLQ